MVPGQVLPLKQNKISRANRHFAKSITFVYKTGVLNPFLHAYPILKEENPISLGWNIMNFCQKMLIWRIS
jgi:hypothetical protein